jgi:hypothetical protein
MVISAISLVLGLLRARGHRIGWWDREPPETWPKRARLYFLVSSAFGLVMGALLVLWGVLA